MTVLMCITLGCAAAKKHKILASFGICYGLNVTVGSLQTSLTLMASGAVHTAGKLAPAWIAPVFQILTYMALGIVSYLVVAHFLGKKLNMN